MSLWLCPAHGLYGGQVFCPKCGKQGEYTNFDAELAQLRALPDEEIDCSDIPETTEADWKDARRALPVITVDHVRLWRWCGLCGALPGIECVGHCPNYSGKGRDASFSP